VDALVAWLVPPLILLSGIGELSTERPMLRMLGVGLSLYYRCFRSLLLVTCPYLFDKSTCSRFGANQKLVTPKFGGNILQSNNFT
jgi:hypothetical protein